MKQRLFYVILLVFFALGLSGCARTDDDFGPVADFALQERSEKIVTKADLQGKVWVASFIFTCCAQSCPRISGSMAQLQHELADQSDVVLVSFSVHPDDDSPEKLRLYADAYRADPERWLFLTGSEDAIYELIQGSFHLGVEQRQGAARTPGDEVLHSDKIAVVDRHGRIRGYFNGTDAEEVQKAKAKVLTLLREKP
ncbi:MAG: SCO family protein [Gemmataceae bacterium]